MILVFGKTGQVARELAKADNVTCLDRAGADLSDPAACAEIVRKTRPKAVINAAAWTGVDQAETNEELAMCINADAPGAIAAACAELGIPFVSISTDYVFNGAGTSPWKPNDPTGPLGAYGRSKLAGEQAIFQAASEHNGTAAIVRTSWVVSAHGNNFVKTMLRLGRERDELSIVADQIGGPTPARDIAAACLNMALTLILEPKKAGIYHFSGAPDVSWADFAREIFTQARISCNVSDIPSAAYPTPAMRPTNSRLDCRLTQTTFGIVRPDWRAGLHDILIDLGEL